MNAELHEKQTTNGLELANRIKKGQKVKPLHVLIYKDFILEHLQKEQDRNEYFILLDLDPDILECRTACLSKYEPLNGRFIFSV